jgi:phosphatidylglycerophosphate synthase
MPDLSYRASLKNPAVEEPIDLLLHRPLGYLIARICYPTPVSPDALTLASMLVGLAAGACIACSFGSAHAVYMPIAAVLFVASAVIDCSDGQLARMRQSSSRYGRMLDGAVDAVVQTAVVPLAVAQMVWRRGGLHTASTWAWMIAAIAAVLLGVRHTTLYDQYKNLWSRNTDSNPRDCDDLEDLQREELAARGRGPLSLMDWFRFSMYRVHLTLVRQTMQWMDPAVPLRFCDMPPYSTERSTHYRSLNQKLMRAWSFFGIGTHIFTMALSLLFERLEAYVLLRLIGFSLVLVVLVPAQRAASRQFFKSPT